ncbi:MAG TPA: M20/M25/M40 family metallo-hydrolase [Polyangiaceae bacterium]|nr:M20/M25/M40 family metallo-hydrolase [Polyangiaceae bacterium]
MTSLRCSAPALVASALLAACASSPPPRESSPKTPEATASPSPLPEERRFGSLRQLTFGGENAEAYWAFGGRSLILQAKVGDARCDRIYHLPLDGARPELVPVSSGKGATTCAYFLPGDREIVYASTHLGGDACPPPPDRSQGYVWALYPSYDIFRSKLDGSGLQRLTDTEGYDAEATVCAKDGSIVFTSVRDGDLELYRMDADGSNVRRLTHTPGYDGGAFFDAECKHIVWRASRPRGEALEEYRRLLAQGLVRPSKLELFVANADGSEARQITYLDAASFAPFFHPSGRRILFSSNYGDPRGREFDLYAIDIDGTRLERITYAPGFDGFPMFSPDGRTLAFASNRATLPGRHDTNVFLAEWREAVNAPILESAADRIQADVRWLADPARLGRGVETAGLAAAGAYVEERFEELGVAPGVEGKSYRQAFPVTTAVAMGPETRVALDGRALAAGEFVPLGFSPRRARAEGELVLAGYGIVDKELGVDDYAGLAVRGKIVVVRRFVPPGAQFSSTEAQRRFGDLRYKAWVAKERGATALLVVDEPTPPPDAPADWKRPAEAPLPELAPEGTGDSGIPAFAIRRDAMQAVLAKLAKKARARAALSVELLPQTSEAFNVVGRIRATPEDGRTYPGAIVIGAHYDHLGEGGRSSLAPEKKEPHVGADDNASGTAALLEIARALTEARGRLRRDVILAAFSAEESGLLGSAHYVRTLRPNSSETVGPDAVTAMINLDMVGRLRENRVQVLGVETAAEWRDLVTPACDGARVDCALANDGGYGPSDQMSFYVAGVPVLHFFTGAHSDYHKPSDTADKVNAAGAAQIAKIVATVATELSAREGTLTYRADARGPAPRGDVRSFRASLGTIPDYAGPGPGKRGVLIGGVRPGGPAAKAGLRRGDLLVRLGKHELASVQDLMFVLNASRPGETVTAVVIRDEKPLSIEVTFEESTGRR